MSQKPPSTSPTAAAIARRDALKAVATLTAAPLAAQTPAAPPLAAPGSGRNQSFDGGWRFLRGDAPGAEQPAFPDASWRLLDLPHDWSVEDLPPRPAEESGEGTVWGTSIQPTRVGPFDTELSEGGRNTGWFVGGIGWYRKHFSAAALPANGRLEIVFDGVYMNSDVWLNGQPLGNHPYGYTSFAYDLTPHLRRDGENVIAVRVRNEGRNTRWYSGSGIYRHVWLNATGPVRVPLWGVLVTTPAVSADSAEVRVAVRIENHGSAPRETTVRIRLQDAANRTTGEHNLVHTVPAAGSVEAVALNTVSNPRLWSVATPNLYHAAIELVVAGKTVDRTSVPFGLRKVEIDAEHGLRLNGEPLTLKGGCVHHDNGLLGACAIGRAEERRVELLKAHGFNAVRTSHNPPSPAFLDACDRLGLLVMDEAFDQWEKPKNPQDYHLYFADWWRRDLASMVLRDRNHPSVILWSIGNEIGERAEPRGVELAGELRDYVHTLDPTRPVTAAVNGVRFSQSGTALDPAFQNLDIAGYNYMPSKYEDDHSRHPRRIIVGTESFPNAAFASWRPVEQNAYVLGDFVWTAMDHLGEAAIGNAQLNTPSFGPPPPRPAATQPGAGPGNPPVALPAGFANIRLPFPWFNCYCGDIDLIGELKPQGFYRRVLWGRSKLEMAVQRPLPAGRTEVLTPWGWSDELQSWTWPGFEGRKLKVRVFAPGGSVRLELNGKEIGTKSVSAETELTAEFEVPYAAGELKAIALDTGKPVAERSFHTTGRPARLRLRADRAAIRRHHDDLGYVTLEVLDSAGNLVPDAVVPVTFTVTGAGTLAAAGSANPKDAASFRGKHPNTYHGRCLAIVRPRDTAGAITVQAAAPGLTGASITVTVA